MVLSARFTKKPRKVRYCNDCGKPIYCDMIRLYGAPEIGDTPYLLYAHAECLKSDCSSKVNAAFSKYLEAKKSK